MSLHTLAPGSGSRKKRKRIGRGEGSGTGKTAGRGHKGYGSRSGSKQRVRTEGGQNPIHMRMRKLRGPNKKTSMPFERFRTFTRPINVGDLEQRFSENATVDLDALHKSGLASSRDAVIKVLAGGELKKPLTVHAHKFSRAARARIEEAGGSCVEITSSG